MLSWAVLCCVMLRGKFCKPMSVLVIVRGCWCGCGRGCGRGVCQCVCVLWWMLMLQQCNRESQKGKIKNSLQTEKGKIVLALTLYFQVRQCTCIIECMYSAMQRECR
ncbi:hypothetical protein F4775DRAFT_567803 [Biscogniauxia sp. FL1348]|nr:hypothetical protein F4775DRAFT_567803 [Biscogniauxia sp. FL1348]